MERIYKIFVLEINALQILYVQLKVSFNQLIFFKKKRIQDII